ACVKKQTSILAALLALMLTLVYSQLGKDLQALKGKTVPDFQIRDLNGKTVKFSHFRGKVVLLNFWSPY
ncbi:MAG: thiol-disulfide oxidoreductase, partial [Armatimonadota bacterium]|nr:thiol-disulfide oxidoreductase [Armatimonadota bacterium]